MTANDRHRFAELVVGIGEVYGESVSDARMELYWRALSDLPFDRVQQAANVHVRTQKFFPRPAELREAIEGSADDRAEIAWQSVVSLVRRHGWYADANTIPWPDAQTKDAALNLYGSWRGLCEHLPASGPEMLGTAKLFKAQYAASSRQLERGVLPPSKEEAVKVLAGLREQLAARNLPGAALLAEGTKRR